MINKEPVWLWQVVGRLGTNPVLTPVGAGCGGLESMGCRGGAGQEAVRVALGAAFTAGLVARGPGGV